MAPPHCWPNLSGRSPPWPRAPSPRCYVVSLGAAHCWGCGPRTVRAKSWTRGWPGHPGKLELRYAPGVDDSDPLWLQEIAAACSRRLLAHYTVLDHNARRCRARLALAAPEADVAALPAVQARAERTVIELLGPTTKITKVSFDDDQLIDLAVSHEAGTKLAAPQYRHRIERVISTMLPGRWRAHWDLEADTVRFEVRPAMPTKVDHPTPVLTKDDLYKLPMAATEDGKALCWNMRGTAPHLMICGKTGTGKGCGVLRGRRRHRRRLRLPGVSGRPRSS